MTGNLAKNTVYLTAASVAQKALAFLYFMLLARVMMPERTGTYFLALSLTAIFSVLTDFGITPVVIREVAKDAGRATELIRQALGLKLPCIVLGIVGSVLAAWILGYDPIILQLVCLAALVMAADAISLLYYGVLRGFHALQFESLGIFFGQLCTMLLGGAALFFYPSLHVLVIVLIAGSVFNAGFSAWQVVRKLGPSVLVPAWDRVQAKRLLRVAFPFALAGIFVKVYSYVDTVFLSLYLGTAAVGVYSVAYKFTYAFQFLPMAFVAALYPGMSALAAGDRRRLGELFDRSMWYMALLGVPIAFGIWAVAPDIILLAGKEYASAAPVLQTLIFVLLPIFLDFPIGSLLNAADRQSTKTAVMGATMVLSVALNAFLIPAFGTMGAAYAALISFWFLFLAGLWFVPSIIPSYRFKRLVGVLLPIFFSGVVMAVVAVWTRESLGFVAAVPAGALAYGAMLVLTKAVRREHLEEFRRLWKREPASYEPPAASHA